MKKKTKAASFYDEYHKKHVVREDNPALLKWVREVSLKYFRVLDPKPGTRFLDLSCGQGHFLKNVSDFGPELELHGLDHSPVAVNEARATATKAKIVVGDALKTGYPAKHFDTVTCLGALEHYPDSQLGLREIHRILKDEGTAMVYVPNLFFLGYIYLVWKSGETPHEAGQNEYEHFETRQGWVDMMHAEGFEVLQTINSNDMMATERVPAWMRISFNLFIRPWVPTNLSYCWAFILRKDPNFKIAKKSKGKR
jgi:ubiquinone/menaquinone biosynthesis C-methylase UbiE